MRGLTISQPFASLIADGHKWIENRSWHTSYRGPLAIHAGKGTQYLTRKELEDYPLGIVAVCTLAACFRLEDVPRLDARLRALGLDSKTVQSHEHAEGPWCWLLMSVRKLSVPLPFTGSQGLWSVPDTVRIEALNLAARR